MKRNEDLVAGDIIFEISADMTEIHRHTILSVYFDKRHEQLVVAIGVTPYEIIGDFPDFRLQDREYSKLYFSNQEMAIRHLKVLIEERAIQLSNGLTLLKTYDK